MMLSESGSRHIRQTSRKSEAARPHIPDLATFVADQLSILLVNVHLIYGSERKVDIERRALETAAVARWAWLRAASEELRSARSVVEADRKPLDCNFDAVLAAFVIDHRTIREASRRAGSRILVLPVGGHRRDKESGRLRKPLCAIRFLQSRFQHRQPETGVVI